MPPGFRSDETRVVARSRTPRGAASRPTSVEPPPLAASPAPPEQQPLPRAAVREARRRRAARVEASTPAVPGSPLLQRSSVTPATQAQYRDLYALVMDFVSRRGIPMPTLEEDWDGMLAQLMDHMY